MEKRNSISLTFIYIGTIIGAGFATGKELTSFFAVFNKYGLVYFALACLLISLSFLIILNLIKNSKAISYENFLKEMFGKMSSVVEIINIIFLFTLLSSMSAGASSIIKDAFNIDYKLCVIIFALIMYFSLSLKEKAVVYINSLLCPVLIVGSIFIGLYLIFSSKETFSISSKAISASFLYASYNAISSISVLFSVKKLILKSNIMYSTILSFVLMLISGIFLLFVLIQNYDVIKLTDLPLIYIIGDESFIKPIYKIVVFLAIYTTAIGNCFALENITTQKIRKIKNKNKNLIRTVIIGLTILFSFLGFSSIVEKVYPVFGLVGILELLYMYILYAKNRC